MLKKKKETLQIFPFGFVDTLLLITETFIDQKESRPVDVNFTV